MTRTKQGGSVRNFILVAVVLVGALAGGIYFMKQTSHPQEVVPPEEVVAVEEGKKESAKKEESPIEPIQGLPSDTTAELPQTGAAEDLASVVAVAVLSLVTISYLRSRRPELSL